LSGSTGERRPPVADEALRWFERARAAGDITAHNAIKAYRERRRMPAEIPVELAGSDWDQAFGCAGDALHTCVDDAGHVALQEGYGSKHVEKDIRPARETDVALDAFDRRDVKRLLAHAVGENDGPDWLALMELWDGRYAYLHAGCDYTGWD
jgi:hypothetical protein